MRCITSHPMITIFVLVMFKIIDGCRNLLTLLWLTLIFTISVNVSTASVPSAGNDTTVYCINAYTLSGSTLDMDEEGLWTLISGSGTIIHPELPNATVTGLGLGNNVFRWTVTNTGVGTIVGFDDVTVRFESPTTANAGTSTTFCGNSVTLTGNVPTYGTGFWTFVSGGGTIVSPTNHITVVNNLSAGPNVLRWNITLPGCSSTSNVTAFYNRAYAGTNQEICGDNTILSAEYPSFAVSSPPFWQQIPGTPVGVTIDDIFDPDTPVSDFTQPGNYRFRWRVRVGAVNCDAFVTVTSNIVSPAQIVGGNQTLCTNVTTLAAVNPTSGTGTWSILTGTGASINFPASVNATVSGLPFQNTVVEWRVTRGSCTDAATITLTNNSPSQAVVNTPSQVICSSTSDLSAVQPVQGSGRWSVLTGTSSIVSPTLSTTGVTGIPFGDSFYQWAVSFPGCPASVATAQINRITPELATVNPNFYQVCNAATLTVTALNTTPGLGSWSILVGTGTLSGSATQSKTTVDFSTDGQTLLQWAISVPGCSPSFDVVTVNHAFVSVATIAGALNRELCESVTTLTGLTPSIGTPTWSFVSGSGSFDNMNSAQAIVSALGVNQNVLRLTVNNSFCSSFINTTLTNNSVSVASISGVSETICGSNYTLTASGITQGTGTWTVLGGGGTFANPTAAITNVTGIPLGGSTYRWRVTKGGCLSQAEIEVVNNSPSVANARLDSVVCVDWVQLRAQIPAQGVGYWVLTTGTGIIGNTAANVTTVTNLSLGINKFTWVVTTSGCSPSTDEVEIRNNRASVANAGNDTCMFIASPALPSIFLRANSPDVARSETAFWSVIVNPGDPINFFPASAIAPHSTLTGFGSGFYRFRWTIQDPTSQCVSTSEVSATVLPEILLGSNVCTTLGPGVPNTSVQLTNNTNIRPARGESGSWTYGGNSLITANLATVSGSGLATLLQRGVHPFVYTVANSNNIVCLYAKTVEVAAISRASAGAPQCFSISNSTEVVGNATNFINGDVGGRGVWTTVGTSATINQSGFTTSVLGVITGLEDGVNTFSFTTSNMFAPYCTSTDFVTVTKLTQPNAGADFFLLTNSITGFASYNLTANSVNIAKNETGIWNNIGGSGSASASFTFLNTPNTTINNLRAGITSLTWRITNTVTGCSLLDTINLYAQTRARAFTTSGIMFTNSDPVNTALSKTLTAIIPVVTLAGETGFWSLVSTNAIQLPTSTTGSAIETVNLSNLKRGVSVFRWTVRNNTFPPGFDSNSDDVSITIMTKALAGSDICFADTSNFTIGNRGSVGVRPPVGERYSWGSSDASLLPLNPNSAHPDSLPSVSVINLKDGVTYFYLTITNTLTGFSDIDTLRVTKLTRPVANSSVPEEFIVAAAGAANRRFVFNANLPNSLVGERAFWNTTGLGVFANINVHNTTVTSLSKGVNKVFWNMQNTVSGCQLKDSVNLLVQTKAEFISPILQLVSVPSVNFSRQIISPSDISISNGEFGVWSLVGSNTSIVPTLSFTNTTLNASNLNRGVYVFRFTIRNTSFPGYSNFSDVTLTGLTKAIAGSLTPNVPICVVGQNNLTLGGVPTVAISPAVGERFRWWSATAGSPTFNGSDSIPNVTFSALPIGRNVIYFSITNIGTNFVSTDSVIYSNTTKADAGKDTFLLANPTFPNLVMYANAPNAAAGETGLWTPLFGSAIGTVINPTTLHNVTALGFRPGATLLQWRITNSITGCNSLDTIRVLVQNRANAGNNVGFINPNPLTQPLNNRTLVAQNVLDISRGETGVWTLVGTNSPELPLYSTTGPNVTTLTMSNLRRGVATFRWIISNSNFPEYSNSSDVFVTVLTQAKAGNDTCITTDANNFTLGNTLTIPIRPVSGERFSWRSSRTGYAPTYSSGADSIPIAIAENLPVGKTVFYFSITNIGTNFSHTDSIRVTKVTKPNAGADQFLIANPSTVNTTVQGNNFVAAENEVGEWTKANLTPSNVSNAFAASTNITDLTPGLNTWRWGIRNSLTGCQFYDTLQLNVLSRAVATTSGTLYRYTNANPSIPINITITAGNVFTPTLLSRGEIGFWTLVGTNASGTPTSSTGSNMAQFFMGNLNRGLYTMRWTISNSNFPTFTNSQDYTFTVMTKAIAGAPRCVIDSIDLNLGHLSTVQILPSVNERISWSSNRPSYIPTFLPIDVKAIANNLPVGRTMFYLTVTNTGTGAVDRDSILVTRVTNPALGSDVAVCDTTYQITPVNGVPISEETFTWQRLNGNAQFRTPDFNPVVAPLDTGNNRFRYTLTNGACSFSDTIVVRNNQPYFATITGLPVSCFTSNTFYGNNPKLQFPTATSLWQIVSQPAFNNAVIVNPTAQNTQIDDMVRDGFYQINYTVINEGCSITSQNFTIERQNQVAGNAGPSTNICQDTYVMKASLPTIAGVNGVWKAQAGSGFINEVNNPNATITGITALETGLDNIFNWEVSLGACTTSYQVIIRSYSPPTTASITGTDMYAFCETDTLHLNTATFTGVFSGTPKWTVKQGNATLQTPNATQTRVSNLAYGNTKILYEISNVNCPISSDSVIIERYKKPTNIALSSHVRFCGDTIYLNAPTPDVGVGTWHLVTFTSALSASTLTGPINTVSAVPVGDYLWKWKVVNGVCSDSSLVNYTIRAKVTPAVAMRDTSVCDTVNITLQGNTPLLGASAWYGPYATRQLIDTAFADVSTPATVTKKTMKYDSNWFVYRIYSGFCQSVDTVVVNAVRPPLPNASIRDTALCSNDLSLNITKPLHGSFQFSALSANANGIFFYDSLNRVLRFSNLPYGSIQLLYSNAQPFCPVLYDTLVVTNNKLEDANAGSDTIICTNTYQMRASAPRFGEAVWITLQGSANFNDNTLYNSQITNVAKGRNVFVWTISNNICPAIRDTVVIENNKPENNNVFSQVNLFKDEADLSATNPEYGIGKWVVTQGYAEIDNPTSPITTARNIGIGENILSWVVSAPGCAFAVADLKVFVNDLIIPVLLTPNNDNYNDKFEIFGLEKYPNTELEVFNRWGRLVFKKSDYDNSWEGQNQLGAPLASDSYLYILKLGNGRVIKDFVTIKR